jgi:hypothetical protein
MIGTTPKLSPRKFPHLWGIYGNDNLRNMKNTVHDAAWSRLFPLRPVEPMVSWPYNRQPEMCFDAVDAAPWHYWSPETPLSLLTQSSKP